MENIKKIVSESCTYTEVISKLGYNSKGGGVFRKIKKWIQDNNIDVSHFKGKAHGTSNNRQYSSEEIFVENSSYQNIAAIKKRLIIEFGFLKQCSICELKDWLSKPIALHLDHINGKNKDNRISNLRFLCPNCHSQTETYSGKNNKKEV